MTETDIVNGGLVRLGEKLILDINEATKQARIAKQRLLPCKRAVLRLHPWNFAVKRAVIAPDADAPAFGYVSQFSLPTDWIRMVEDADTTVDQGKYRIEGRKILSNASELSIRYVSDADYPLWDALAVQTLSLYLAWDICFAITDANTLKPTLWEELSSIISKAKFTDSADEPAGKIESNELIDAAFGGTRSWVRDPQT